MNYHARLRQIVRTAAMRPGDPDRPEDFDEEEEFDRLERDAEYEYEEQKIRDYERNQ